MSLQSIELVTRAFDRRLEPDEPQRAALFDREALAASGLDAARHPA